MGQSNPRKPGSLNRKMHGSNAGTSHFDQGGHGLTGSSHLNNHHKSLNSPTTAPSLNEKYGVGSSHIVGGSGHQMHGSYNHGGSSN